MFLFYFKHNHLVTILLAHSLSHFISSFHQQRLQSTGWRFTFQLDEGSSKGVVLTCCLYTLQKILAKQSNIRAIVVEHIGGTCCVEKSMPLALTLTSEKWYQSSVITLLLRTLYPHYTEETFN